MMLCGVMASLFLKPTVTGCTLIKTNRTDQTMSFSVEQHGNDNENDGPMGAGVSNASSEC